MAWEKRKGGIYFYTARRVRGRLRKTYHGRGKAARQAAAKVAAAQTARRAEQDAARTLERLLEPLDLQTRDLDQRVELLLTDALLAQGFHIHKGQWRRRRERNQAA